MSLQILTQLPTTGKKWLPKTDMFSVYLITFTHLHSMIMCSFYISSLCKNKVFFIWLFFRLAFPLGGHSTIPELLGA